MKIKFILLIIMGALLIILSVKNMDSVTLHLFSKEMTLPLFFLIYIIFFLGFLTGVLYYMLHSSPSKKKDKLSESKKRFKLSKKEKEVAAVPAQIEEKKIGVFGKLKEKLKKDETDDI